MTVEERLARVETLYLAIAQKLGIDVDAQRRVDGDAFERAIQALAAGDRKPLQQFIRRGGKIPTNDPFSLDGRGQG